MKKFKIGDSVTDGVFIGKVITGPITTVQIIWEHNNQLDNVNIDIISLRKPKKSKYYSGDDRQGEM